MSNVVSIFSLAIFDFQNLYFTRHEAFNKCSTESLWAMKTWNQRLCDNIDF